MRKVKMVALLVMICMSAAIMAACTSYYPYPAEYFNQLKLEENALEKDANLRVMSANVLVHMKGWGGTPVAPRAQMFAEVVDHYSPDVVALQEYCGCWYKQLPPQLDGYAMMDTKQTDYTTIMYNSRTMQVIEQGVLRYSQQSNRNCRFVVWGVMKHIASNKLVIVTSTHWDFGMEEEKVAMRKTQTIELIQLMTELQSKYNAPVVAAGDYNMQEITVEKGAESYEYMLSESGALDAKFVSGVNKKALAGVEYLEQSWDHIFIKGAVLPLGFGILYNSFYAAMSDHPIIYLDAKI